MIKTYTIEVCLADFKDAQHGIEFIFDLIAKVKAAVFAQSGEVRSFAFSNKPDPYKNPYGIIGTLSFEIATHDEYDRELVVEHWINPAKTEWCHYTEAQGFTMVSFRRFASTKEPLNSPDPDAPRCSGARERLS
jgi:hypothetical protein